MTRHSRAHGWSPEPPFSRPLVSDGGVVRPRRCAMGFASSCIRLRWERGPCMPGVQGVLGEGSAPWIVLCGRGHTESPFQVNTKAYMAREGGGRDRQT